MAWRVEQLKALIAAGNTAVVKPSEICEACATPLAEVVPRYLDPEAVADVQGAIPETTALLARKWDMIFFTGSPPVGKIVHQAPAKNLTPAVLALGGKNPTIVHSSAELKTAASRIAFTRFINSGHVTTKASPDYGRVINRTNFDRLVGFMENGKIVAGGESDAEELYIAPTVLVDVPVDSVIMQDEVSARSCRCSRSTRWTNRDA